MRKNSKRKPIKKKKTKNYEARGLFVLSLNIILLLSLISFNIEYPHQNWLGLLGFYISYVSTFIFGLGSYLFILYLSWIGWKLITMHNVNNFIFKTLCFSVLMISLCMLLNVAAETHPSISSLFDKKIHNENLYFLTPSPHKVVRYNLGGVPLYYLYKDIPFFNLQKILSNVGCSIIFSFTAFISFLLFTGIHIVHAIESLFLGFINLFKKKKTFSKPRKSLFIFIKEIISKIISHQKAKKKTALPQIRIKESKPIIHNEIPTTNEKKVTLLERGLKINTIKAVFSPKKELFQKKIGPYHMPSYSLLTDPPQIDHPMIKKELTRQAEILEETLKNFGIEAKVGEINCGPTITSFEVHPSIGVKVQKIKALENDIALNLQAKSIRIIAPIPGKAAVGVEIPSIYPQEVSLKEMIVHYQNSSKHIKIPLLLGKTVTGDYVITDLTRMPHCLIAGATGSGKSVCINTIVMSILMNSSPDDVKMMMIDPKKVELTQYSNLPHMLAPVITEAHGAYAALQWLVKEMSMRYEILKQLALRNITAFNARKIRKDKEAELNITIPEKMPLIVCIIDEFADLMMVSSSDLEAPIARIAQMARAVGIHLLLATQRPSREVITGIIKANFPCRIAFKVASRINSQIILDEVGAESLLGNGDLLFSPPGSSQLVRAQGAYIRDEDINQVIDNICAKYPPNYLIPSFDAMPKPEDTKSSSNVRDLLYDQALSIVLSTKNASTTYLQRKLKIGYARAASLMDELEENGVIGPQEGSKARRILSFEE